MRSPQVNTLNRPCQSTQIKGVCLYVHVCMCVVISTHYCGAFVLQTAPDKLFHWHCSAEIKPTEMKSKGWKSPFSSLYFSYSFSRSLSLSLWAYLSERLKKMDKLWEKSRSTTSLSWLSLFQADHRQSAAVSLAHTTQSPRFSVIPPNYPPNGTTRPVQNQLCPHRLKDQRVAACSCQMCNKIASGISQIPLPPSLAPLKQNLAQTLSNAHL